MIRALFAAFLWLALVVPVQAERARLATTTSTENSGLLSHLAVAFEGDTGIALEVVAVGTGQALELGRRGDAAVLLVHHRAGELDFIREGHGRDRRDVMHNDFVIVGPADDPAGVRGTASAVAALAKIARARSPFLSRGDDSGTHRKEREHWTRTGILPEASDGWYRETGSGMGRTLNTAVQMDAYTLTDRGTWLAFENKSSLEILLQTDPPLNNPYSSILVTSSLVPRENAVAAQAWHEWLTGPRGQASIASFRVNGEQLFFPAASSAVSN